MAAGVLLTALVMGGGAIAGLWAHDFDIFVARPFESPSAAHNLGTDALGRDLASRTARAGALTMLTASMSALGVATIGGLLGVTAGLRPGAIDRMLVALANAVASVPPIVALLGIGLALGPGYLTVSAAIVLTQWPATFRTLRVESRRLDQSTFVLAARAMGANPLHIIRSHILPNLRTLGATIIALQFAWAIRAEAVLAFLGFSPALEPSWGRMLANAASQLDRGVWWPALAAGLPLFLVVLSAQTLADYAKTRA